MEYQSSRAHVHDAPFPAGSPPSLQPFSHGDSDAAAGSDPVTAAVAAAAGSLPPISLEKWEEPPEWLKQVNRGAGIMFNSGVVALLRAYMNPPPPTVVSGAKGGAGAGGGAGRGKGRAQ